MLGSWWASGQLAGGLCVLVLGGEVLVRGASRLAAAMRISPLVIGLTVVAFGTSSPELAVSVRAAHFGSADLALGNVVGSNIFNIVFILGTSALIVPLVVSADLIRRDVPLMIAASGGLLLLGWDGRIQQYEGALMAASIVAYTWWCISKSRQDHDRVAARGPEVDRPAPRSILLSIGSVVTGLVLLGIGSRWLVDGASSIAANLGVSELIIGLTIVAAGTSLPEVVTSIVAAVRGERDIAVGNVVGSNLFNILCVLGLASMISPAGIAVSPRALSVDIPVMIAVAVACFPIFVTGHVVARWEGGLFLFYYVAYTVFLLLDATGNDPGGVFGDVMIWVVVPLTVVALAASIWHSARSGWATGTTAGGRE